MNLLRTSVGSTEASAEGWEAALVVNLRRRFAPVASPAPRRTRRVTAARNGGRIDPACFVATARGVLRRRSPESVRIVGGALQFFDRRAIRTSPVPPGGTEKRQLRLSQSTRPSLPRGRSLPRKRPVVLQTAREWLRIVRDRIEILVVTYAN
jgi:hypothetical protein